MTGLFTLIIFAATYLDLNSLFPGAWALLPTIGAVLIIAAGSSAWLNRVILSSRPIVWIGLISFPLYLWHWPLLALARIQEGGDISISTRMTLVVISIVLSWLTYRYVEMPIRFNLKYRTQKNIALIVSNLTLLIVTINSFGFFKIR